MPDTLIPGAQFGTTGIAPDTEGYNFGVLNFDIEQGLSNVWNAIKEGATGRPATETPVPESGFRVSPAQREKIVEKVNKATGEVQKKADVSNPFFSFLGLQGTSWQDVGVMLGLALLLLVGVLGLLNAAK